VEVQTKKIATRGPFDLPIFPILKREIGISLDYVSTKRAFVWIYVDVGRICGKITIILPVPGEMCAMGICKTKSNTFFTATFFVMVNILSKETAVFLLLNLSIIACFPSVLS